MARSVGVRVNVECKIWKSIDEAGIGPAIADDDMRLELVNNDGDGVVLAGTFDEFRGFARYLAESIDIWEAVLTDPAWKEE